MNKITKNDFLIVWEWHRQRIQGLENYGYYKIVSVNGKYECPYHFSSKAKASAWLGKNIKIANKIKSGEIKIEK